MSSLRSIDLSLIEEIMRGGEKGYILDFSNSTFRDFFARELDIDIDHQSYATDGSSKARRLRCLLTKVDDATAARVLKALWEHREALRGPESKDPFPRAAAQFSALTTKLASGGIGFHVNVVSAPQVEAVEYDRFRTRLENIRDLPAQQRGYEFEKFLKDIFDAFRLSAREPFRLIGEQIDGSFELAGETYLVEAKWLNRKVGVAELGAFHSKLEQKAAWTRGLFVSFMGFSDEGLQGFGRGRRLIGMDGRDLYVSLGRGISLDRVISLKVRRAAETGEIFVPIDTLIG